MVALRGWRALGAVAADGLRVAGIWRLGLFGRRPDLLLLQRFTKPWEVNVAIDEEDGIVGTVVAPREAQGIGAGESENALAGS